MRVLSVLSLTVLIVAIASACASTRPPPRTLIVTPGTTSPGTWIDGLSPCSPEDAETVRLDPNRPLTLFVPGASYAAGDFRALADVFEAHGQQTLCFNYDDRERLDVASGRLVAALEALEKHMPHGKITVFGHSQGGLIGRHALVRDRKQPLRVHPGLEIILVTVASPFQGIASARTCGLGWLHVLSFGATAMVCQGVAGAKWRDIHPSSRFMRRPGTLGSYVKSHLMIVTDERGACRQLSRDGRCAVQDHTFGLDEQYSELVEGDRRVEGIEVKAGHSAIVGGQGTPPDKLIRILEGQEILESRSLAALGPTARGR